MKAENSQPSKPIFLTVFFFFYAAPLKNPFVYLKIPGFSSRGYAEKLYDENGILTTIRYRDEYLDTEKCSDFRTMMLSESKLPKPRRVEYYDADGNLVQRVRIIPGREQQICVLGKDGEDLQILQESISMNKDNSYFVVIRGEFQDECFNLFNWNVHDGKICLDSTIAEVLPKEELKETITKTANKLEEAYRIIQKEDMLYRVGKDGEFTHIDIPTVVQQMRDFVSSY